MINAIEATHVRNACSEPGYYPALLSEQANCINQDKFVLHTVTDRNIAFSGTPVTCYLLSFGKLVVNPVHFLLTENIKTGYQGIIV